MNECWKKSQNLALRWHVLVASPDKEVATLKLKDVICNYGGDASQACHPGFSPVLDLKCR